MNLVIEDGLKLENVVGLVIGVDGVMKKLDVFVGNGYFVVVFLCGIFVWFWFFCFVVVLCLFV